MLQRLKNIEWNGQEWTEQEEEQRNSKLNTCKQNIPTVNTRKPPTVQPYIIERQLSVFRRSLCVSLSCLADKLSFGHANLHVSSGLLKDCITSQV